jgi:hypothetical protein
MNKKQVKFLEDKVNGMLEKEKDIWQVRARNYPGEPFYTTKIGVPQGTPEHELPRMIRARLILSEPNDNFEILDYFKVTIRGNS